jgi:hypothetical protein
MIRFVAGVIFGIIVATVGFSGPVAGLLDGMMSHIQKTTIEHSAPNLPPPNR